MQKLKNYISIKRIICIMIVMTIGLVYIYAVYERNGKEKNYMMGIQLFNEGQYSEAQEIFYQLKYYKDSLSYYAETTIKLDQHNSDYEYAQELFDNCQYQDAIDEFEKLGNFRNSEEMLRESKYLYANELFGNRNYEKALQYYDSLTGYKDSDEMAEKVIQRLQSCDEDEVLYQSAYENYNLKKYRLALDQFQKLQNYKNSEEMLMLCQKKIQRHYHTISAGILSSIGILDDGSIIYTGDDKYKQSDFSDWKNITVKRHTVGGVNGRLISAKVSPRPHSRSGNRRLTAA